jgi:hypothetical protein
MTTQQIIVVQAQAFGKYPAHPHQLTNNGALLKSLLDTGTTVELQHRDGTVLATVTLAGDDYLFTGFNGSTHRITADSSPARLLAHWDGFGETYISRHHFAAAAHAAFPERAGAPA